MTSLIFGSIYLGHKGIVNHRREKQRVKNYQRWEGLRDEYDEQRKISRESRSLDIQRTGSDFGRDVEIERPILTLRDQQEANDARTSWRPQETWDDSAPSQPERRNSVEVTAGSGLRPVSQQKTGATWDDGLPQPLRVSRRNWDEYQPSNLSANVSRSGSLRNSSGTNVPARDRGTSKTPPSLNPSPQQEFPTSSRSPHLSDHRSVSMPSQPSHQSTAEAVEYTTPGGRMAELIESGFSTNQQHQQPNPYSQPQLPPFSQSYQGPFPEAQQGTFSQPQQAPYGGFRPNIHPNHAPSQQAHNPGTEEWWNRPL